MTENLHELVERLQTNMSKVVLGKPEVVRKCLVAFLAGEHLLLEDVPGVGKTLVGKAIAKSIDGQFHRVQFTPDLLPSDIVGSSIFNSNTSEFLFQPGPIFANIVLADEINRAPPRTQSALLEAMSDNQVSVDGKTHPLPRPFMVIATQNPFEFEGTYALPESQLDRFLLRISLGYPPRNQEREVLQSHRDHEPVDDLTPVVTADEVTRLQKAVRGVTLEETLNEYLLDIVHATRTHPDIQIGLSTRGMLSYYRAAQAVAFVQGRDYVVTDDIKDLAVATISHRVIARGVQHGSRRDYAEQIIEQIVDSLHVPV